jgi:hypothetical protein
MNQGLGKKKPSAAGATGHDEPWSLLRLLAISSPFICICSAVSIRSFTAVKASYGAELLTLSPVHNLED